MRRLSQILTLFMIMTLPIAMSCKGPAGSEGPQGPEGAEGPVGPAGEDGSKMYSGQGAPGSDLGRNGDYYLNTNTGEMYGPKDDNGWGNPIMVLKGEDGQDGEDGSQIYSGNGAPDSTLGAEGDYYLDKSSYDLYGPKTSSGWGTPINLKGADGNANVTRYIFPGHDFAATPDTSLTIESVNSETEMRQSAWLVYLVRNSSTYWSIPGNGHNGTTFYNLSHEFIPEQTVFGITIPSSVTFNISTENSVSGEEYSDIEVVRIRANNTEDHTKQRTVIPDEVDVADYGDVASYYGFGNEQYIEQ